LLDLVHLEPAQIFRGADRVEERRFTECGHSEIPNFDKVGINGPTLIGLRKFLRELPKTPYAA
jgi:hypothetical protein